MPTITVSCLIFLFVAIGLISFLLRKRLASTDIGKAFSLMVAGLYVVRVIAQFLYFPADNVQSTIFIVMLCGVAAAVYLIPPFT